MYFPSRWTKKKAENSMKLTILAGLKKKCIFEKKK